MNFGVDQVWSHSVRTINRPSNSMVLIAHLARCPILGNNVLFRRCRNEHPPVCHRRRPCATFMGGLRREPGQPIRAIPETVEVVRGTASDAIARRIGNVVRGARRHVYVVGIRNDPYRGRPERERLVWRGCAWFLRGAGHGKKHTHRAGKNRRHADFQAGCAKPRHGTPVYDESGTQSGSSPTQGR